MRLLSERNKYSCKASDSAFTLIELSIVLVIIALLVGGVIAGRALLRQSEVNSTMVDAQKYISAVQAFQQKYGSLPGDMANAVNYWGAAAGSAPYTSTCYATGSASSVATCNGNGDGQINYTSTYSNETLRAWQHLANAQMISGAFTGTTGATYAIGTNAPASRVGKAGFGLAYIGTLSSDTYMFDGVYGHVLFFGANYASSPYLPITAAVSGSEALSLDTKFDDGMPALGSMRTWKNAAYSIACASSTAATATYISGNSTICSWMLTTGF